MRDLAIKLFVIVLLLINSGFYCCYGSNSQIDTVDINWLKKQGNVCKVKDKNIIICRELDLSGRCLVIPDGSNLYFKKRGRIYGGSIYCSNLFLSGNPQIASQLFGSVDNKYFKASWISTENPKEVSNIVTGLFQLQKPVQLILDKDLIMDGSTRAVNQICIKGNGAHTIKDICHFSLTGNLELRDCIISGVQSLGIHLFDFDHGRMNSIRIEVDNCHFFLDHKIDRVFHSGHYNKSQKDSISIQNSVFNGINNFIVDFKNCCSGEFAYNQTVDCGTSKYSHVSMLWLGDGEHNSFVDNWFIHDNHFGKMIAPYSDKDDGREVHAILVYGNHNRIENNQIDEFISDDLKTNRPGKDAEGIYIKGGNNIVVNNTLINCIGASPDGAITIKLPSSNCIISSNTILHDAGLGIQCYSDSTEISNNTIVSTGDAESALCVFVNTGSIIMNNLVQAEKISKKYKAAIEILNCQDVSVFDNQFRGAPSALIVSSCLGNITYTNNQIYFDDFVYSGNTYYNAPFIIRSGSYSLLIGNNRIHFTDCKASQIVYCDTSYNGILSFSNNSIFINKNSIFVYVVRNRPESYKSNLFEFEDAEVMKFFKDNVELR